ncbi:MAG TPA: glycosyltransferase family 39 protein [Acidimicrobiales bacterium]|nr:glycosyltransferase family 39 protein [Acidimicrobiales bacterium]
MTLSAIARHDDPAAAASPSDPGGEGADGGPVLWLRAVSILAVLAGVGLRAWTRSPMWLDEALTVNIASVGLDDLRTALERDGAPPLYYLLLTGWRNLAGDSDTALRLLSALFSVATLVVVHRIGRRRGGATVATAAVVLLAVSPYAVRYATEARMYSLVALLVSLGWLALDHVLERPAARSLFALGLTAGLLLLTHYWGFYLLAAVGVALAVIAWRVASRRRSALLAMGAIAAGCALLFGPWIPTFLSQLRHTGAPWGEPPDPVAVAFTTLVDFGGGPFPEGQAGAALLVVLGLLALFGSAVDNTKIELDLRTRPGVRADLAVAAAALLLGAVIGFLTQSAWASRYASIAFPIVIVAAAHGLRSFADRRLAAAILAAAALLGVAGGVRNVVTDRTQAGQAAAAIEAAGAGAGDVVVYCPDQLGPDVHRALQGHGLRQFSFPDFGDPRFVDWVDYEERMGAADPGTFAAEVLARARGRDVFYVWMPGYRTLGDSCERVNDALAASRGANRQLLEPSSQFFERHNVWVHPASPP